MPLLWVPGKHEDYRLNRTEVLRRRIDKHALGLEIGPSHNPVASKREGYRVRVLDHLDQRDLIEKYKDDPSVDTSRIEEVDFVWRGEPFSALVNQSERFSWIMASHVVEHVPDLVRFLNECDAVMEPGGVLTLAVPDKRFCFDHFRPHSSLGMVVDAHLSGSTRPSPGTVLDFYLNYVRRNGRDGWNAGDPGRLQFVFDLRKSMEMMSRSQGGNYVDVHQWCFTPSSFRLLIGDLHRMGLIQLQEVDFVGTDGFEFFVWLSRAGSGSGFDHGELLRRIDKEAIDEVARDPIRWGVRRLLRRVFS